jgi:uncharacterized protein YdhG (YjbR/CyaY superfamily)
MIAEKMDVTSVEAYIAGFPEEIQAILQRVRATIKEAAPDAQEAIKYGLPTMVLHGNLVHFGAFRDHIGFCPTPSGIEAFRDELRPYRLRKGTVQFPLDEPIPYDLIRRITRYRVQENLEKARRK